MNSPPTPSRLTVGEWLGIIGLSMSLIGGLMDIRVQLATLRVEVAALRHDFDRKDHVNVDGPATPHAANGRNQGKTVIPSLVSPENLVGRDRASTVPTVKAATLRGLSIERSDSSGQGRGPHHPASRYLVAFLRRKEFTVAL